LTDTSEIDKTISGEEVYKNRGLAYYCLDKIDLAKKDFEKFLSLVPEDDQTAVQIKQFLNSLE